MTPDLDRAIRAAKAAGDLLLDHWQQRETLVIDQKRPGDFVSAADRGAEMLLREALIRDGDGWLGEETEAIDAPRRWIVDPLDGTTNFLHGLPHWAISIALEHKGQIVAGVIFDPAKDEMFLAEKGEGAWMNDKRLRVSGRTRMIESIFATGLPFGGRSDLPATLQDLARLLPACAGVRRWGSAALDLAYVAAGRYDGFWERRLNAWDLAAGDVLVREAGGFVQPIDPKGSVIEDGEIIAANTAIFDTFASAIRG